MFIVVFTPSLILYINVTIGAITMESNQIPHRLYKYTSADNCINNILKPLLIRFTQPESFNDPFELLPHFQKIINIDKIKDRYEKDSNYRQSTNNAMLEEIVKHPILQNVPRESLQEFTQLMSPIFEIAKPLFDAVDKGMETGFRQFNRHVGILCLSEEEKNILMWAHYAQSHTGFSIEFNASHPFFDQRKNQKDELRIISKVIYASKRPSIHLNNLNYQDLCLTKSQEWGYEKEWRIIVALKDADRIIGDSIYLYKVPPTCITGVIIGCRTSQADQDELVDILNSNSHFSHVRLLQAQLDETGFDLQYKSYYRFNSAALESVLDELLPAGRKDPFEDYDDLLADLNEFNIYSIDALKEIIQEYIELALAEESALKKELLERPDVTEQLRGLAIDPIFRNHAGIIRTILEVCYGDDWCKYCYDKYMSNSEEKNEYDPTKELTDSLTSTMSTMFELSREEMLELGKSNETVAEILYSDVSGKYGNANLSELLSSSPVVQKSWENAQKMGRNYINSVDLLNGILKVEGSGTNIIFSMLNNIDMLNEMEDKLKISTSEKESHSLHSSFSVNAEVILIYVRKISKGYGLSYMNSSFLLHEILRNRDNEACRILESVGIAYNNFYKEFMRRGAGLLKDTNTTALQYLPIKEWVGEVFFFLPKPPTLREYGYISFGKPYEELVNRWGTVTKVTDTIIDIQMNDNYTVLQGIRNEETIRGIALLSDLDFARLRYLGKTLWFNRWGGAAKYDNETDICSQILIERLSPIKVISITSGWYESEPVRFHIQNEQGEIGFYDVAMSGTNSQRYNDTFFTVNEVFLHVDPCSQFDWSNEVWQCIKQWEVMVGMDIEQVRFSLGHPLQIEENPIDTYSMCWIYNKKKILFYRSIVQEVYDIP